MSKKHIHLLLSNRAEYVRSFSKNYRNIVLKFAFRSRLLWDSESDPKKRLMYNPMNQERQLLASETVLPKLTQIGCEKHLKTTKLGKRYAFSPNLSLFHRARQTGHTVWPCPTEHEGNRSTILSLNLMINSLFLPKIIELKLLHFKWNWKGETNGFQCF